jgi:hypothetical protein
MQCKMPVQFIRGHHHKMWTTTRPILINLAFRLPSCCHGDGVSR